jgi:hypothetical protein
VNRATPGVIHRGWFDAKKRSTSWHVRRCVKPEWDEHIKIIEEEFFPEDYVLEAIDYIFENPPKRHIFINNKF